MVFIVLNFIIAFIIAYAVMIKVAQDAKPQIGFDPEDADLCDTMKSLKYVLLVVASVLVIGAGTTYQDDLFSIAAEAEAFDKLFTVEDLSWLFDILARFGGGIATYFLIW